MQNKIIWSQISNKSNVKRWNYKKLIIKNDLKNKIVKKKLISGQLKIWFYMCSIAGHNFSS
jgi:hypothetical protein